MRSVSHQDFTWYDLVDPTEEDLHDLQEKYEFHELDIEDCLSEQERPKIDEYEEYLFLVLHIPYVDTKTNRVIMEEINLFIGDRYIVTLHDGNLGFFDKLFSQLNDDETKRAEFLGEGAGFFLYELINVLFESGFPIVDGINRQLRALDKIIFEGERDKRVLLSILGLKRDIITMRRILLPQRTVVSALEHKSRRFIPEELDIYFDDVQDAVERQWSLLETAKEVVEALQDSHETWIQSRTNRIIRVLTVFSVTMLPLTFITGLYGMNVSLPHAGDPYAFIGIVGIMFILLVGFLGYFGWKRWI